MEAKALAAAKAEAEAGAKADAEAEAKAEADAGMLLLSPPIFRSVTWAQRALPKRTCAAVLSAWTAGWNRSSACWSSKGE